MILGPGSHTMAPYMVIPKSKFYVAIIQDDYWCINEDCGIDGAIVQTLGGWLEMETIRGYPDLSDEVGYDFFSDQSIKSIIIIGDSEGKIAGIYLNKGFKDVLAILKMHPDLADFNLLKSVNEFGFLKVGDMAPLKPGDDISNLSEELSKFSVKNVPKGKKFYLYSLQKRKYDMVGYDFDINRGEKIYKEENKYVCFLGSCRYPEVDPPHDFLFANIEELGGWFLANDEKNEKMIELFGLDPKEVLSGRTSLVVLTDSEGVIVTIHPNKTLSDTFTILSQHPKLADIQKLYRN